MSMTRIYILMLLLVGSFVLQLIPLLFYFPAVFAVYGLIFIIAWILLRKDPHIPFKRDIIFMVVLTALNISTSLGVVRYSMCWLSYGALGTWVLLGNKGSR